MSARIIHLPVVRMRHPDDFPIPPIDEQTLDWAQREYLAEEAFANPPRVSTLIAMLALAEGDEEREAIIRQLEARP
jgi:hypothetical protein